MVAGFSTVAAIGLTVLSGVNAVISITSPHSQTVWYANNTVTMNWTVSAEDTYDFRAFLSNSALLANAQPLADQTPAQAEFVHVLLPQITYGEGYIVTFVNTTNTSQVFATSQEFKIEAGALATTTQTSGVATVAASQTAAIPNFTPSSGGSAADPFATTSPSGSATKGSGASGFMQHVPVTGAAALAVVAAAVAL